MTVIEKKLTGLFQQIPREIAPGFHLQVHLAGKKKVDLCWGETWAVYDLASLTKILFTTPALVSLCAEKKLGLQSSINKYLRWWPHNQRVEELLAHGAGNIWWKPFYKKIDTEVPVERKKLQLRQQLRELSVQKNKSPVYSDIDFLLLGFLLEELYERSWSSIWEEQVCRLFPESDLSFLPVAQRQKTVAPTELCPWRGRRLQGEVHDDNAWSLGGVAPHAGLFGGASDVSRAGLVFQKWLKGHDDVSVMFRRFLRPQSRDWCLGFMRPTPGRSSSGQFFSTKSFGHTGFTGTSLWIDPKKELQVVLLSNRVYHGRQNSLFQKWRPWIHDQVVEITSG